MSVKEITFSPAAALESILYIASLLREPTIHEVLKVRYFADKLHLSSHGCIASGDDYVAMKFGPVASGTYDLMKAARGDRSGWMHPLFPRLVMGALEVGADRKSLRILRKPNLDSLSPADRESIELAVRRWGNMGFQERTDLSHDQAWRAAWEAAAEDEIGQSPMPMESIAGTLRNAQEVIAHIKS